MSDFTNDEIRILKKLCAGLLGASAPAAARPSSAGRTDGTMKFGRSAGVKFSEAAARDLEWYAGALESSIANPDKAQYRANNEADVRAIRAELASRTGDRQPSLPSASSESTDLGNDMDADLGDIPF